MQTIMMATSMCISGADEPCVSVLEKKHNQHIQPLAAPKHFLVLSGRLECCVLLERGLISGAEHH